MGCPLLGLLVEPVEHLRCGPPTDDVDELRGLAGAADVHDRGAPLLAPPVPDPTEQGLVEAERVHGADAFGVGLEQRLAVGEDGVVDGVPVTAQILGDLADRPAQPPDLAGRPPRRPGGHRHPGSGDALIDMGPRPGQTGRLRAAPTVLAPHQPDRPAEAPQVDQLDHGAVLDPSPHSAGPAPGWPGPALNMHTDRFTELVVDGEHGHVGASRPAARTCA